MPYIWNHADPVPTDPTIDYSQNGEQAVIAGFFSRRGIAKGTFIDAGAGDGVSFSNTYALALAGWDGVLIEPHPESFVALLRSKRSEVIAMNCGVDTHTHLGMFQMASVDGKGAEMVSTFSNRHVGIWEGTVKYHGHIMPIFGWHDIRQYMPYAQGFDFISIDVEGMAADVLRSCPIVEFGPRLVVVEHEPQFNGQHEEILNIMRSFCYEAFDHRENNIFFRRNGDRVEGDTSILAPAIPEPTVAQ